MKPGAGSTVKRYGCGPGRMTALPGFGAQIIGDTKRSKKAFLKDLRNLYLCMIAGRAIFRQMFRHTSFVQHICSGN